MMQNRGTDASGIVIYFNSNKLLMSKYPNLASKHAKVISKLNLPYDKITMALAHARAYTSGTPYNNENNHPLYYYLNGRLITLVHNGVITNAYQKRVRKVDSDSLFFKIRESKKFDDETMKETLKKLYGSMAVMITDGYKFYFYRNTNPLEYAKTDKYILFASTWLEEVVDKNVEVHEVEPNTLFKIEKGEIKTIDKIESDNPYYPYYYMH